MTELAKKSMLKINPYEDKSQKIGLSEELIALYSLEKWSKDFSLMTAGYRDQLDPEDIANPKAAFNILTIAILAEAKARVFKKKLTIGEVAHVHIGGETRPHTQEFIGIISRVYAAHDMIVHLNKRTKTTPIWYSSFGIFYNEFHSGENVTASHSPFFKGGWKPMDSSGKQLLEEEEDIVSEVYNIIKSRTTIKLAPWLSSGKILRDFDVDEAYVQYQQSVLTNKSLAAINQAVKKGFKCAVCPVGGSMKAASERLFKILGISTGESKAIQYFYGEEDSQYHQIGQLDGGNVGPDPGKRQVYKSIGAQKILNNNKANIVFIWDPDGDRFNIVTIAAADRAKQAAELGLEVESCQDNGRYIVYFTPNQIFFMLTAYRISTLKSLNLINAYDWFVTNSISTSRSISELAAKEDIQVVNVRVGFKYMGTFADWIENRDDISEPYVDPLGDKIFLGELPRALIMCEESGGAVFGGVDFLKNRSNSKGMIALREKDGMQFALLTLSLSTYLFNSNQSFAEYYCDLITRYNIKNKYYKRSDVRLYDESLSGEERDMAKKAGTVKRDKTMNFFKDLADQVSSGKMLRDVHKKISSRLAKEDKILPCPKRISFVGDGTLLEFDTFWFLLRASGTDALLRYYIEGQDKEEIEAFQNSFINIQI